MRKYRSSLQASLAAYHSLSAVLRDRLFCFTDFQLIGPHTGYVIMMNG
jgi:hypothetical protein